VTDDGMPWSSRYATEAWELGVGGLLDITVRERTNVVVGARVDYSRAENIDYAGTLNLAAGTAVSAAVFRTQDDRASGRDAAVSWSVSVSHRTNGVRPYLTVAEQSLALDENNNKYENAVIEAGHIGRARLVEAGVKATVLDDRLYVAAAAYEQARVGVSVDDAAEVLDAHVSSTSTRGVETELRWEASEDLLLSFYGLRQRTEFAPNAGANVMVDARALGFRDVLDASGNVVYPAEAFLYGGRAFVALPPGLDAYAEKQGNPETQLGLTADYRLGTRLALTLSGNYFSSVFSGRLRWVELPAATVFNVGVSWRADRWLLRGDVLNAFDERWFRARTGDTLGDNLVSAMPGRRWQLTLRTRF
jgi:hypothetical protein